MVKCFDLPVEIIEENADTYLVKYEDGVEEIVSKHLVEFTQDYKKQIKRSPIKSRKSIKKTNPKRKKKAFKKNFHSEGRVLKIKAMGCVVKGCWNQDIVNAHMKSRGSGGTYKDILPLCNQHHTEEHSIGNTVFIEKYSINVKEEIKRVRTELGEI